MSRYITLPLLGTVLGLYVPSTPPPVLPLTLRDAIDIASDYEILHPHVPYSTAWYGWTDPETKQIFMIANSDLTQQSKTRIHEFLHVSRRLHGRTAATVDDEEKSVRADTESIYAALYRE